MEGNFELNQSGWYTVQQTQENEFLNSKLESNQYGIWYSVQFAGDAETYLWQTKTPPVKGERYWGWLEKTKSGKATKFKWDKQNAPSGSSSKEDSKYLKDVSDVPVRMIQSLLPYYDVQSLVKDGKPSLQYNDLIETARALAEDSLSMVDNIRSSSQGMDNTPLTATNEDSNLRSTAGPLRRRWDETTTPPPSDEDYQEEI